MDSTRTRASRGPRTPTATSRWPGRSPRRNRPTDLQGWMRWLFSRSGHLAQQRYLAVRRPRTLDRRTRDPRVQGVIEKNVGSGFLHLRLQRFVVRGAFDSVELAHRRLALGIPFGTAAALEVPA